MTSAERAVMTARVAPLPNRRLLGMLGITQIRVAFGPRATCTTGTSGTTFWLTAQTVSWTYCAPCLTTSGLQFP